MPSLPSAHEPRAASASRRARLRPDVRWIAAGVVVLSIGSLLRGLFGPEPRVRVSRETTLITGPLAPDGLPDYKAHLLALAGPAPPPEENAAVPLLQTLWPMEIDPGSPALAAVCTALGIPDTSPRETPLVDAENDPAVKAAENDMRLLQEKPWLGDEHPAVAAWLDRSGPAIDRLLEASRRPRYWFVSPTLLSPKQEMLVAVLLPDVQSFRRAARALAYRGMWHLGAGRTREAWEHFLAIHRLSRLLGPDRRQAAFLINHLVAIAVARTANDATRQLLADPDLSAADRETIHRDLAALPPLFDIAPPVASERLMGVDTAVSLAAQREGTSRLALLHSTVGTPSTPVDTLVLATSLDWNVVLSEMNAAYDGLDVACGLPTPGERDAELKRLEALHARPAGRPGVVGLVGTILGLVTSRTERSVEATRILKALLLPAVSRYAAAVDRAAAEFAALVKEAAQPAP